MRRRVAFVISLWLSIAAWAQNLDGASKITPGNQVKQALDPAQELRLAQKVSLREAAIPLRELIRKLARETGLDLRVVDSVRNFRACLLVNEQPLYEVLQRLADAFGFHWTRQKERDGKEYYMLLEPREARAERERLSQFITALRQKEPVDILREALARIPDFAFQLSYEEHQRATGQKGASDRQPPEPDPRLQPLLKPVSMPPPRDLQAIYDRYLNRLAREILLDYAALQMLGNLRPAEWQHFRQYERLTLPLERVPQESLERYRNKVIQPLEEWDPPFTHTLKRLELFCSEEQFVIYLVADQHRAESSEILGTLQMGLANITLSSVQQILTDALESLKPSETEPLPALSCRLPSTIEPAVLNAWVHLPAYLLLSGTDTCKLNLVGEWSPLWLAITAEHYLDISWASLLRCFARGYKLTHEGQWLVVQARLPALARALDISEAEFKQWLAREGLIDIDTAVALDQRLFNAQIDALRWLRSVFLLAKRSLMKEPPPQLGQTLNYIEGVIIIDSLYNSLGELLSSRTRRLLRFYGSLNAAQRATFKRGIAIGFAQLNSAQQGALASFLMRENTPSEALPYAQLRLEIAELPQPLLTLHPSEGGLWGAWYSFSGDTAREWGIPFVQGCQFTIELPSNTPDTPMRRLRFPLMFALK